MKKLLFLIVVIAMVMGLCIPSFIVADEETEESIGISTSPAGILEGWIVPDGYEGRVSVTQGTEGVIIDQLIQGTPVSHAVAIAAPITDMNSIEVEFKITAEEYVESGRLANDVWTGIGFMGKPVFINWMNSVEKGLAKDSPCLFTRFFNYAGDLKLITDVYCENYNKDGDNPDDVVDTWRLLDCSAGASASDFVTMKLVWEEVEGRYMYNLYINGVLKTTAKEFGTVKQSQIFPDGKVYIEVAMNTQEKDTNANTQVIIRRINDQLFYDDTPEVVDDGNTEDKKSGCSSTASLGMLLVLSPLAYVAFKRKNV